MKSWSLRGALGASCLGIGLGLSLCGSSSPSSAAGALDLSGLTPYFPGGPLGEATRKLRAGEAAAAEKALAAHLKQHPKDPSDKQLRFLLALAQLRGQAASQPQGAAEGATPLPGALLAARSFDQLASDYPLLLPYERLYAARAYLLGGKPQEALERARKLPPDQVLGCEARFVRGEAQRRLGQREAALSEYQDYLKSCDGAGHRAEAEARAAEVALALGRAEESLGHWRHLYVTAPLSSHGVLADRQLDLLPADKRRFSAKELLERAQVFFDNMRNPESEAAYRRVLELPPAEVSAEERCVAKFQVAQSVFKLRQRPRAAPMFDEAAAACAPPAVNNEDMHMKALYQGARCHGSKGELQQAADLFAQAEAAHPGHSYADDSRLRQAEMYADLTEKLAKAGPQATCQAARCPDYDEKATAILASIPERFPAGDQRAEALWRLAFRAYRKKDFARAQALLSDSLARVPRESGWDQEGRTLYWLGRLAEVGGKDAEAAALYQRTAREYPLSFYTLLAFNRLRERAPKALAELLTELQAEPAGEETSWRFPARPLFQQAGFQRAVELLRLSLGPEAKQEFLALGIKAPEGKGGKVASAEQEELLWLTSLLYQRAGEWHQSHWIPRHTLNGYARRYPTGAARKQWLLSYPRGYEELLSAAAAQNGQPEGLQFAIVREESAFDPLCESFANAIGLTQMIPPTAKRFAAGLPTTREALRDPATNVAIGARFLGFLWSTMQGNPALAISGYNAGEGAVFRWLQARGDLDLDAWIEAIPFDETRGYTKRVLSSFLTYNWIYMKDAPAGRIPALSLQLPGLPQAKKAPAREEDPHRK